MVAFVGLANNDGQVASYASAVAHNSASAARGRVRRDWIHNCSKSQIRHQIRWLDWNALLVGRLFILIIVFMRPKVVKWSWNEAMGAIVNYADRPVPKSAAKNAAIRFSASLATTCTIVRSYLSKKKKKNFFFLIRVASLLLMLCSDRSSQTPDASKKGNQFIWLH